MCISHWKAVHVYYYRWSLEIGRGLINKKNDDNECLRWCHARFLNPQENNPQRIEKSDRNVILYLDYDSIEFPVSDKDYSKVEAQNSINVNVIGYEGK